MEEIVYLNSLFDYYGELLTKKQQNYFQKYYFENLTMQEIADEYAISKTAVANQLELIKTRLLEYEKILKNNARKEQIIELLKELDEKTKQQIIDLL